MIPIRLYSDEINQVIDTMHQNAMVRSDCLYSFNSEVSSELNVILAGSVYRYQNMNVVRLEVFNDNPPTYRAATWCSLEGFNNLISWYPVQDPVNLTGDTLLANASKDRVQSYSNVSTISYLNLLLLTDSSLQTFKRGFGSLIKKTAEKLAETKNW